jgi:hypothetical protein
LQVRASLPRQGSHQCLQRVSRLLPRLARVCVTLLLDTRGLHLTPASSALIWQSCSASVHSARKHCPFTRAMPCSQTTSCSWATTSACSLVSTKGNFKGEFGLIFESRYANETAELISKLLEEVVVELAAVKNAEMALHLAVAMLQVGKEEGCPQLFADSHSPLSMRPSPRIAQGSCMTYLKWPRIRTLLLYSCRCAHRHVSESTFLQRLYGPLIPAFFSRQSSKCLLGSSSAVCTGLFWVACSSLC